MEMALGCTSGGFEALADKVAKLVKPEPPTGLVSKIKKIPELAKIASYPPKVVKWGICQEVVLEGERINCWTFRLLSVGLMMVTRVRLVIRSI